MRQRTLPVFIKKGVGSLDELRRTSKIRQYQKSKGKNVNKLLLKLSSMSMNTTITDRNYGKTCVKQYYRGRGWILNTLFKIPLISCHWLSELYKKKKESGRLMQAVANNSNLLLWVWLCYATLQNEHNHKKLRQNNT